jgi:hypothetical protein
MEEEPVTLQDAQRLLLEAQSELRQVRKAAEALREAFLDRLIGAMNITDDKTRARILKRIQKAEDIKKIFRKLRFQRKSTNSNGISTLTFQSTLMPMGKHGKGNGNKFLHPMK